MHEFTIDENGFINWIKSKIGSHKAGSKEPITVTNGLYYGWSKEDQGVSATFDRNTNRAYYSAHYH